MLMLVLFSSALLCLVAMLLRQSRRHARMLKSSQQALTGSQEKFNEYSSYRAQVTRIMTELQQSDSFESLARSLLTRVAPMIGAHFGAVYVLDEDTDQLLSVGNYGAQSELVSKRAFSMGEGLIGQCAKDKQGVTIVSIPDTPVRIVSGVGYTVPRQMLFQALVQKGKVVGVIEFAAITSFQEETAVLLDELMPTLAMNIEILDRNIRTRALLEAKRAQAQLLQEQQEQLKLSFEQLESNQLALQEKTIIIEASRREIQEIHQHTRDSIEYAAIIQQSILPKNSSLQQVFPASFAVWKPKDIVGGDIWFFETLRTESESLLFVIDCTGHGVPGAFVTMLVKSVQRGIMSRFKEDHIGEVHPGEILAVFNREIKQLLDQSSKQSNSNAGFDGGIVYFDKNRRLIRYAGAETPLFLIDKLGKSTALKGSRHSVGYRSSDEHFVFDEHEFSFDTVHRLFLTTDGLLDQNGGPKDIPYGKKRLVSLIQSCQELTIEAAGSRIMDDLVHWQGAIDRNDDICYVGIEL